MKGLILSLTILISASAFAMDPAAQFLSDTLNTGNHLLGQRKSATRTGQLCQLAKDSIDYQGVAERWLGSYANITTDQAGVSKFIKIMPSLLITKVLSLLGNGGAKITVYPNATDIGGGDYSVNATIDAGSNSYTGNALIHKSGNKFVVYDGQYWGFSGVSFLGQDFQNKFNAAAQHDPRTPVSDVVHDLMSDPAFVACP